MFIHTYLFLIGLQFFILSLVGFGLVLFRSSHFKKLNFALEEELELVRNQLIEAKNIDDISETINLGDSENAYLEFAEGILIEDINLIDIEKSYADHLSQALDETVVHYQDLGDREEIEWLADDNPSLTSTYLRYAFLNAEKSAFENCDTGIDFWYLIEQNFAEILRQISSNKSEDLTQAVSDEVLEDDNTVVLESATADQNPEEIPQASDDKSSELETLKTQINQAEAITDTTQKANAKLNVDILETQRKHEEVKIERDLANGRAQTSEKFKKMFFDLEKQFDTQQTELDKLKQKSNTISSEHNNFKEGASQNEIEEKLISDVLVNSQTGEAITLDQHEGIQKELGELKSKSQEQQALIEQLKSELSLSKIDLSAPDAPDQLKAIEDSATNNVEQLTRSLKESETCMQMIEDELDTAFNKINELENALAKANESSPDSNANNGENIEQLKEHIHSMHELADQNMESLTETNLIVGFMKDMINRSNYESIGVDLLNILQQVNVIGSIHIKTHAREIFMGMCGEPSDEEKTLLRNTETSKKSVHEEEFIIFPKDHITLITQNIEMEDDERQEYLIEYCLSMISSADIRISSLVKTEKIKEQAKNLTSCIDSLNTELTDIENEFQNQNLETNMCFQGFVKNLNKHFDKLNLEENSKAPLLNYVDENAVKIENLLKESASTDQKFKGIINNLDQRLH